jgi:hypothetical protein
MPRGKAKNFDPVLITPERVAEIMNKKHEKRGRKPSVTPVQKVDKDYFIGMYAGFVESVESNYHISENRIQAEAANGELKCMYRRTPFQMWDGIKKYLKVSIESLQPLTITGIALFSGASRDMLLNVSARSTKKNPIPGEFSFLKEVVGFVEMYNEYAVHKKQNPAGPIFILKNFGWKDKIEIEASSTQGALSEQEREETQKRLQGFSE